MLIDLRRQYAYELQTAPTVTTVTGNAKTGTFRTVAQLRADCLPGRSKLGNVVINLAGSTNMLGTA